MPLFVSCQFFVDLGQSDIEITNKPHTSKDAYGKVVKTVRRKTSQTSSAQKKIRISLAGLRGEGGLLVMQNTADIPLTG